MAVEISARKEIVVSDEVMFGSMSETFARYGGKDRFTTLLGETLNSRQISIGDNLDGQKLSERELATNLFRLTHYYLGDLLGGDAENTPKSYSESFRLAFNSPHASVRSASLSWLSRRANNWRTENGLGVWYELEEPEKTRVVFELYNKLRELILNDPSKEVKKEAIGTAVSVMELSSNQHKYMERIMIGVKDVEAASEKYSTDFAYWLEIYEKNPELTRVLVTGALSVALDTRAGGARNLHSRWEVVWQWLDKFLDKPQNSLEALSLIEDVLVSEYYIFGRVKFVGRFTISEMVRIVTKARRLGKNFGSKANRKANQILRKLSAFDSTHIEAGKQSADIIFPA